jgi:hypothetical protein
MQANVELAAVHPEIGELFRRYLKAYVSREDFGILP